MKFSTRTRYGLKAVLLLASRYGEGSLSVSQIARKEDLSLAYLEQILNTLKKKGLVKSVRGPQGGYMLTKRPAAVNLKELLDFLVGENALTRLSKGNGLHSPQDEAAIAHELFWQKFKLSLEKNLSQISLKDLLDEARSRKKLKNRSTHNFQI